MIIGVAFDSLCEILDGFFIVFILESLVAEILELCGLV
jgi:hypothetical protein